MGSTTGVRIARDLANRDPSPVFDALAQEIAKDRQTLLDLMDRFGAREDHVKVALGWVAERASQLKFKGELRGYTPLSLLEEIETLSLGVEGKLAMWEALRRTHAGDPRLGPIDLDALIERARLAARSARAGTHARGRSGVRLITRGRCAPSMLPHGPVELLASASPEQGCCPPAARHHTRRRAPDSPHLTSSSAARSYCWRWLPCLSSCGRSPARGQGQMVARARSLRPLPVDGAPDHRGTRGAGPCVPPQASRFRAGYNPRGFSYACGSGSGSRIERSYSRGWRRSLVDEPRSRFRQAP